MKRDKTCLMCGRENTHECGDDFLCDRCCNNMMASEEKYMFKWLHDVVVPYATKMKNKRRYAEELVSIAKGAGVLVAAFVVMMILYRLFPHLF